MHAARWRENRPGNGSEEVAATLKAWWLIRVRLFQIFSSCSVFASVFLVFFPLRLRQSLSNGFLHFLRPCCRSYMQKKLKPRPTGSPCWFMVSLLFSFFFLFFLFYCQSSQPHSNTGEWKKLSLFSVFFSPTVCLSFVLFFLLSFFLLVFPALSFFFSPPLSRSLEGLIYSLKYLYLGKI